jgi:uncharacterized protein YodC (DUF2158 family)
MTPPLLKEGDVVRLVSGGPSMTITSVTRYASEAVHCNTLWFNDKTIETGSFPESSLKRVGWFRRVVWD